MPRYRINLVIVAAALLVLTGCASAPANSDPEGQAADTNTTQQPAPDQGADIEPDAEASDTTVPTGAYAASDDFPFPIPEGWEVLDPFAEEEIGKDKTIFGSVEYPGDAKEAAAVYLRILADAGFDAYTYAPGEMTNQASLAAEGSINGTPYFALLDFDVHADGYQRVSINIVERES